VISEAWNPVSYPPAFFIHGVPIFKFPFIFFSSCLSFYFSGNNPYVLTWFPGAFFLPGISPQFPLPAFSMFCPFVITCWHSNLGAPHCWILSSSVLRGILLGLWLDTLSWAMPSSLGPFSGVGIVLANVFPFAFIGFPSVSMYFSSPVCLER